MQHFSYKIVAHVWLVIAKVFFQNSEGTATYPASGKIIFLLQIFHSTNHVEKEYSNLCTNKAVKRLICFMVWHVLVCYPHCP